MHGFPFSQLNKEFQIEKCTIPSIAPVTINPDDETKVHVIKRQTNFLTLPENIKTKLVSPEIGKKILQIGNTFHLELLQMASIARAIRNYYFGEIKLEDLPKIFMQEMKVDEATAQKISQMAIQQIIRDDSYEKDYAASLESAPFNEAMKKYSAFGEQTITSQKIKLQGFPEPVRPSVKNWIADFTSGFGYERNNPMKRQDYIFRSANGQNLNQEERERLSFVLRSFEENSLVNFQKDTKQLIFGQASRVSPLDSQENSVSFTPKSQPEEKETAPSGNLSFSFPQRMPFEKPAETIEPKPERPVPAPIAPSAPVVSNANPNIVKIAPKPTPVPKNVVNLKDFQ